MSCACNYAITKPLQCAFGIVTQMEHHTVSLWCWMLNRAEQPHLIDSCLCLRELIFFSWWPRRGQVYSSLKLKLIGWPKWGWLETGWFRERWEFHQRDRRDAPESASTAKVVALAPFQIRLRNLGLGLISNMNVDFDRTWFFYPRCRGWATRRVRPILVSWIGPEVHVWNLMLK